MTTLSLPSIDAPQDWTTDPRSWLPDADTLAQNLHLSIKEGEPQGLQELLSHTGAPPLDMLVTPMSSRATLIGLREGRAFAHHELRTRIPMPPELEPEVAVWNQGTVPVWNQGVLTEPKYFSFFQDAPIPVFNPNHRRKWRSHELLHAGLRFYWNPSITRVGFYQGARIAELLPVLHWYGFDEAFRPRCPEHRGKELFRAFCPKCEAAAIPWWETSPERLETYLKDAPGWLQKGLDHFAEEWKACLQEWQTGKRVETVRPGLNASSDSVGYLRGHWNRITSWSFGAWVELFMVDGEDYFSTIEANLAQAASVARDMTSGEISLDLPTYHRKRNRRVLQDLGYRALLLLEWVGEESAAAIKLQNALMPLLEAAGDHASNLLLPQTPDQTPAFVQAILDTLEAQKNLLPRQLREGIGALGYFWPQSEALCGVSPEHQASAARAQLKEGIQSALPLCTQQSVHKLADLVEPFALSQEVHRHGLLAHRLAAHASAAQHPLRGLADFESWLAQAPHKDADAEDFGALPEDVHALAQEPGELRLHLSFRRRELAPEDAEVILGDPNAGEIAAILKDEPRIMLVSEEQSVVFDALEQNLPLESWLPSTPPQVLEDLLENSFLVWLPRPA